MEIRRLDLRRDRTYAMVISFLIEAGLRLEEGISYMAGMYDDDERLIGCGGVDGNIIKCLALTPEARGEGASATLISHLINEIFATGATNVRVFTKPEYKGLFRSLGFSICGEGSRAIWLESDSMSLKKYCDYLSRHRADGVIVANCDPMTLGHLHLISRAAEQSQRLAVIAVGGNLKNTFRYHERLAMLRRATEHLGNVEILEGSEYVISQLSFPSYFIKRADEISATQAELDLDIFCRHIAPALGCKRRYVGSEPIDALTEQYNRQMQTILPTAGIEVVEMERISEANIPISASRVRSALQEGRLEDATAIVPATNTPYLLGNLAIRALRKELNLSPKPGLVDPEDNGSHRDMDYALMSRSIDTLRDYFVKIAEAGYDRDTLTTAELRALGMKAEEEMLRATGGVNTHRGAIFSMGLAVAASARILAGKSDKTLSEEIAEMARGFSTPGATHGQDVKERYGKGGALENAQSGYRMLFESWLPYYRQSDKGDIATLRLLMTIISELDDSNAIYRAGLARAEEARRQAAVIADSDRLTDELRQLNEDFKRDNISHGGAADMLALTIFIDSLGGLVKTT
ncbi:MAG: [citrate (pro-3S)-lyase] ligase [Lepagella sp.]